jgi:ribonuclease HII
MKHIHGDRVLGIDEAGRGPIVGPMVMAAVALHPRASATLTRAGIADSKAFAGPDAHEVRSALVPRILSVADHVTVRVLDPHIIDVACADNGLNRLEQQTAAHMIDHAPPCKRIVCDGARLFAPLRARYAHLEAHDGGESVHVAVAAASIVAKVRRDEIFAAIWRRYAALCQIDGAPRGGGYLNDATRAFLRVVITRTGRRPPEGRHSWPWTFAHDLLPELARAAQSELAL